MIKIQKKLFLYCMSLFLLGSCVKEENQINTPQGIFDALWTLIDRNYCFLDYKAKEIGINWYDVRTKYQQRIQPSMNSTQLFEVLKDMLSELKDGHVNLYTAGDIARYWSWHTDYPKNWDKELRDSYLGNDYMLAGSLKYRILTENIGYVVCESFSNGFSEGNINQMLYNLRSCNGLIIDVRGNSGGQLNFTERLAAHFTNKKILVGYTQHKTGPGHNEFSSLYPNYLIPSKGIRWQKSVIVLTNRECYSACNIFVRDMAVCPNITILGDKTGGGSGMPFSSELPNGWQVRYSAEPSLDIYQTHIEFGIAPDIYCALDSLSAQQGKDTIIEKAKALINSKE